MAYGNYNGNGGYQKPAASSSPKKSSNQDSATNGVRLTNYDAMRYMNINYWKRALSIDIGPIPQGVTRSNPAPWDWNASKPTMHMAMTFTSLTVLEEICDEVWESIKKTGSFTNVGAPCGADLNHLVEINNGSTIGQPAGIYIVLYKDRDQSGRAQSYDFYPCSSRVIERDYDPNTGNSTKDITKTQDFKDFRRCIHEAVSAFTMAYAHSVQEVQHLEKLSILNQISAICAHNGITVESVGTPGNRPSPVRNNGNQNSGGGWKSNNGYRGNNNGGNRKYGGGYGSRYGVGNNNNRNNDDTPPWSQDSSIEVNLNSPEQADFNNLF